MMKKHFGSTRSFVLSLGRHLLALVIFWIVAFAFVQLGIRLLGGWPASEIGQLLACVLGVGIAFRLRAPLIVYFLAAMTAFKASELTIHLTYGIRAAQGAPTHFAVMGAGILGVALGALLRGRGGRSASDGEVAAAGSQGAVVTSPNPDGAVYERRSNMPLQPSSSSCC